MQAADLGQEMTAAQRYLDAWNRHDAEGIVATFTEGGTYSDPTVGTLAGPAIAAYAGALFAAFPDLQFEVQSATPAGDHVVAARWLMRGTNTGPLAGNPPSGREIALPGVDFITVDDGKVRSVQGYFDQKTFFEQLGLQVLLAPQSDQNLAWGVAAYARSGRRTKPAAFSTTWIDVRDEQEQRQVANASRQVVAEMGTVPGFISWLGVVAAGRMFTATAWEDAETPKHLMRQGSHKQAMGLFFAGDLGTAVHTSVWAVDHQNPIWVRCAACKQVVAYDEGEPICRCGRPLPPAPPYW
jgi:steroid delta-isomerase-like uncharacterized protein